MSWHPYERNRRLWTVYWGERPPPNTSAEANVGQNMLEFELTEPYSLNRDVWRDLQLDFLSGVTPPGYTLNISQLWTRLWPQDGAVRFSKLHDIYNVPILLSSAIDTEEQPGKRQDFFWTMAQLGLDRARLEDLVFFQNVDLENITWITPTPLQPWPGQVFEHNKVAFAWNHRLLKTADLDVVVRQESWGLSVTYLGHLDFLTIRERRTPEEIMTVLQEGAERYDLELEVIPFARRPRKPNILKSLGALPGNLVKDGWAGLKGRNSRPS